MAAGFRYLGAESYGKEGVAGHVSVEDPVMPDCYWINPLMKHFTLMKASDLVLIDSAGQIVRGQGGNDNAPINTAAWSIHGAIHRLRPDVKAAVHCHSIAGKAWSTLGRPLDITTQDSTVFYNDHAVYKDFGGVAFGQEEGVRIAEALGDKRALILQNHGLLTCGQTVDEAVYLFGVMDRCCQVQIMADQAAASLGVVTEKIRDEEAFETWKSIGTANANYLSFQPEFEVIDVRSQGDFRL